MKINKNIKDLIFKVFIISILFISGIFYYLVTDVRMGEVYKYESYENSNKNKVTLPFADNNGMQGDYLFETVIFSKINQGKILYITADDVIKEITINSQSVNLGEIRKKYNQQKLADWDNGYPIKFELKKGNNTLRILTYNQAGGYTLKINKKVSYFDFLVYFMCFSLPIIWVAKNIFTILDFCLKIDFKNSKIRRQLPIIIVFAGIILRLLYIMVYGYSSYNHDHYYHIEFINFFAEYFEIPPPDKAMEFPQQPLYYAFTGSIYRFLDLAGMIKEHKLFVLGVFSLIFSIIFIIYAYKFIKLLTKDNFIINTFLSFLCFTPSFIFMSGRISNDVLTMTLGIMSLYYLTAFYFKNTDENFIKAVIFIMLAFVTKINSLVFIILFTVILFYNYIIETKNQHKNLIKINDLKNKILIFGTITVFMVGLTILRVYMPSKHQLLLIKSSVYEGQQINNRDISYFLSFNIIDLLKEGQAYVYDTKISSIRQSFLTYQYGTMMFGEYDYKKVFSNIPFAFYLAKIVYLTGIIYLIGFVLFIFKLKKESIIIKFLTAALVINVILVIHLSLSFPSACNTDFRYYAPTFALFGLAFAFGINYIKEKFKNSAKFINVILFCLFVMQISWVIALLIANHPNSVT